MLRMNWGSVGSISDVIMSTLSRLSLYWPLSWRVVSAWVLGVLLAQWFWVFFAPQPVSTSTLPERSATLEAGQLFGVAASADTVTEGVALPNVQLLGVFAASAGKNGFAVLKMDDKRQLGVAEGEEVTSGTRLVAVHADHVMLERAGIKQRINLETKYTSPPNKTGPATYSAASNNPAGGGMQKQIQQLSK
jgi:general secretion pathway protein C